VSRFKYKETTNSILISPDPKGQYREASINFLLVVFSGYVFPNKNLCGGGHIEFPIDLNNTYYVN
jgi:hypothetical protein